MHGDIDGWRAQGTGLRRLGSLQSLASRLRCFSTGLRQLSREVSSTARRRARHHDDSPAGLEDSPAGLERGCATSRCSNPRCTPISVLLPPPRVTPCTEDPPRTDQRLLQFLIYQPPSRVIDCSLLTSSVQAAHRLQLQRLPVPPPPGLPGGEALSPHLALAVGFGVLADRFCRLLPRLLAEGHVQRTGCQDRRCGEYSAWIEVVMEKKTASGAAMVRV